MSRTNSKQIGYWNTPRAYNINSTDRDGMLRCKVCGHTWMPRSEKHPLKCPSCRSIRWNSDTVSFNTCRHCGHTWVSANGNSRKCPECQTTKWKEPPNFCKCLRCGHKWESHSALPRICPSCKSRHWNEQIIYWSCPNCNKKTVVRDHKRFGLCPVCDRNRRLNKCSVCGHKWKSSRRIVPTSCPKCLSTEWMGGQKKCQGGGGTG